MHSFRVAAAQINAGDSISGNVEKIAGFAARAKRRKADAILFPECAVTGYQVQFDQVDPARVRSALADVSEMAAHFRINILIGTPLFLEDTIYNCQVVFDRTGEPAHAYAKCQLTASDREVFTPGNAISLFEIDGIPATAIICHERRFPELVRIATMAGARIVFHPNAGLDTLAVSRKKRNGRDGIPVRAFENGIFYVFANTVGPQGKGKWSAGDSKMVAPDESILAIADNETEALIAATLDLERAHRKYAGDSLEHPAFLSDHWKKVVSRARSQSEQESRRLLEFFA